MTYSYNDIKELRQIRVFELRSTSEGTIGGDLKYVSLDHNPVYEALSYAWGNPNITRSIICGDRELYVPANCYSALVGIHGTLKTRTLWVDSICINQENQDEKADQILLMREIFGKARRVIIWLGEGNDLSNYAFDWIEEEMLDIVVRDGMIVPVGPKYTVFPENVKPSEILKVLQIVPEIIRTKFKRLLRKKKKAVYRSEAMKDLFGREWFKRMWTIQELVMANDPVVVCGNKAMRYFKLARGIVAAICDHANDDEDVIIRDARLCVYSATTLWYLLYFDTQFLTQDHREPLRGFWQYFIFSRDGYFVEFVRANRWRLIKGHAIAFVVAACIRFYRGERPFNSWKLFAVVMSCWAVAAYGCSQRRKYEKPNARRIVQILHALRTRRATKPVDKVFSLYGIFEQLGYSLPKPNYTKSVVEVYTEFTKTMILQGESLEILKEAGVLRLVNAPSWVPDWSRGYQRLHRGQFWASKNASPLLSFGKDNRTLECMGLAVDSVKFCTGPLQKERDDVTSSSSLHNIKILRKLIFSFLHEYPIQLSDSVSQAIFDALHSDIDFTRQEQDSFFHLFNEWARILTAECAEEVAPHSAEQSCALLLSENTPLMNYHIKRCNALAGERIFFTTEQGNVGSGPLTTKLGQRVVLVAGCSFPLLMTPVGLSPDSYSLIGVAWVSRMMNGEMWPEDGECLQNFTLY